MKNILLSIYVNQKIKNNYKYDLRRTYGKIKGEGIL